ncbi:hypothetical protein ACJMK2_016537 [Sinanodonta woodiana]|uniref:Uncharacterized protein n=1 Tax=Sinanodonta woodiana TaxID=1069815 RepID=A0ABD3UTX3_SINWO
MKKISFSHEREKRFYQGNRVNWWNFNIETHVLTRHCFNSLKEKVQIALTSPTCDQQKIITVSIIHEPGAGGTTLAKHILWEFRTSFKCAMLERLTEHAYDEIYELWKMFETDLNSAKPVLLLADRGSQVDITFSDLCSKINFMYRKKNLNSKIALPVCVLLTCVREEDFAILHEHDHINEDVTVLLRQKLEEKGHINEKEWCVRKYQEIENLEKS